MSDNLTEDRYTAGMVLSGVGDALGYKRGKWEFCTEGEAIRHDLKHLGGLKYIGIQIPHWPVSDDTIMHLATARALLKSGSSKDKDMLHSIASEYKKSLEKMRNRHPENTCMKMCKILDLSKPNGLQIPFNLSGGGCGAAMRSMCIGLRYPNPDNIDDLINVSIEAGRLTHHHPTGYLGSLASALFASYAVQGKRPVEWGAGLLETLKEAKKYIKGRAFYVEENLAHWDYFVSKWHFYLGIRNILDGKSTPLFPPDHYLPKKQDQFYALVSYDKLGGASGHDAPMIAYDAILGCKGRWELLCEKSMFHGGNSDSTGAIAGCLYGILYGLSDVQECNYKSVEFREEMESIASGLFNLASGQLNFKYKEANDRIPLLPWKCNMI